jgi:23S rRNA (uracil1939-C5)-methyltransferase
MKFRRNDIAPVSIEKLALGGRGVGFTKDATFFVQDSVPGDEVEARVTFHKKRYAEAELGKIIKPSPDRIAPRCKHFGSCGGCSWQMLPYEKQLFWKEKQVRETLQHVGGFVDPEVLPMMGTEGFAQGPWFYRNKMEWSFDPGETGDVRAGFHLRGRWHDVVQVEECFLQSTESVEIFKVLRGFFAERARVAREKGTDPLVPGSMTVREGKRTQAGGISPARTMA